MISKTLAIIFGTILIPPMALSQAIAKGDFSGPLFNAQPSPLKHIESRDVPVNLAPPKALKYKRQGGGDSGGGGSAIWTGHTLRLRDFAQCSGISNTVNLGQAPTEEPLSNNLSKLSSSSVKNYLKMSLKVSDRIFESMIWAAAAHMNWYVVNASLQLDADQDLQLAVFKRSIGTILDKNLTSQLSALDFKGLLFHESLRMVSLGFELSLSTKEIEEITCDVFASRTLNLKKYPSLASHMAKILASTSSHTLKANEEAWSKTYEAISNRRDVSTIPNVGSGIISSQTEHSKFETFRSVTQGEASPTQLEEAFYGWAAQEAPSDCHSEAECGYHEVWPKISRGSAYDSLRRWNLFMNDNRTLGWRETAADGRSWLVSKHDLTPKEFDQFCANAGREWKIADETILLSLFSNRELSLLVHRNNLTSMAAEMMPFVAKKNKGGYLLWTPDFKSDGYQIISDQWASPARALCVRSH